MTASEVWRSGGRNKQNPYHDRLIGKTVIVTLASLMMRFGLSATNPLPPITTDANALILLPLWGVQPTWRDMLLTAVRSKVTHSAIPAPSMPHCKILTRDHKLGPQSYSVWDI
jgi:hypothetical protein